MFDRAKFLAELEDEEGLVRVVYDDKTSQPLKQGDVLQGNPTFGIGLNLSVALFTDDQLRTMTGWVVDAKTTPLYAALPWLRALPESVQRGVADIAFNVGLDTFLKFTTFISLLKAGDFVGAAQDLETGTLWWKEVGTRGPKVQALISGAMA